MNKSITKSKGRNRPKASKECPRADVPARGNSPDWYTREALPYKGENFNALTSLTPQPSVMFGDGVATNVAVLYRTVVSPPIDQTDSFYKKAADFYAEIRERNSGAANYNVMYLAAYMYNVGVLHTLCHGVSKIFRAVRSVMPSSADSPYILSAVAGIYNYEDVASRLANLQNRYTILAKDIENLPLPHVTAFDRSRFLYSNIFADSKGPKPAIFGFLPQYVVYFEAEASGASAGAVTPTSHVIPASARAGDDFVTNTLHFMEGLLEKITSNTVFTIIRGDIRNAFGNAAYWEGLVSLPGMPLNLIAEDPEVTAQLENINIIPRDTGDHVVYEYNEDEGQYVLDLEIDGINDSPSISRLWLDNNLVNYHGGSISDGELLAITRMMYVGKKINRLTKTDARILATSGDTVYAANIITEVSRNNVTYTTLGSELLHAQTSTIQSTATDAMSLLAFTASNVNHFPMVIFKEGPRAYLWNTENYAILSNVNLHNMTIIANRSLWDIHLPRGEMGRIEKRA